MGWLVTGIDSVAAAVFLNAGVAKLVAPDRLRTALAELATGIGRVAGVTALRAFAVAELVVAACLLPPAIAAAAAVAASALGLCFCVVGVLGLLSGSKEPCGCFGASGQRPLGWTNIGVGLALAAVAPLNLISSASPAPGGNSSAGLDITATAALALCLWANRRLAVESLRRKRVLSTGGEVT